MLSSFNLIIERHKLSVVLGLRRRKRGSANLCDVNTVYRQAGPTLL